MASWMIHLRIADRLLDELPGLSPAEFIVGNMAPDSGVPNADWSSFTPSTKVSHFRTDDGTDKKEIDLEAYLKKYFTPTLRVGYDQKQDSFYLGYYVHLLTDCLWSDNIVMPCRVRFAEERAADRNAWIWRMKADWYDLDFKYLRDHPDFRAFRIYQAAAGFSNTYMEEFSPDAFDNRREYITGFYLQEKDNLDREYKYLTGAETDRFVEESTARIRKHLEMMHGFV